MQIVYAFIVSYRLFLILSQMIKPKHPILPLMELHPIKTYIFT